MKPDTLERDERNLRDLVELEQGLKKQQLGTMRTGAAILRRLQASMQPQEFEDWFNDRLAGYVGNRFVLWLEAEGATVQQMLAAEQTIALRLIEQSRMQSGAPAERLNALHREIVAMESALWEKARAAGKILREQVGTHGIEWIAGNFEGTNDHAGTYLFKASLDDEAFKSFQEALGQAAADHFRKSQAADGSDT